jgi:hypothetical protein
MMPPARVWPRRAGGDLLFTGPESGEICMLLRVAGKNAAAGYRWLRVLHDGRERTVQEWWRDDELVLSLPFDR